MENFLNQINPKKIEEYRRHLEDLSLAEATIKRRLSTLRKFTDWAEKEGYLQKEPVKKARRELPSFRFLPRQFRPTFPSLPYLTKAYETYNSISITRYLHYAVLIIFCVGLGMGIYNQLTGPKAELAEAYPSTLQTPKRYLSFQGRLTDSSNNPITSPTNFVFKIYDALGTGTPPSGGNQLWTSGNCSIDPDQDGIFSVLLGKDCGSEIDATVFSENAQVYLQITVGTSPSDETLSPRIQIATVGYALSAETLQGFPPGTDVSNIPYIDSSGDITIAAASPSIVSSSGTFGIEGQALSITTASGTNGNITIAPDGTGVLNINLSGTTGNQMRVTDANITSGALISGYAGTGTTGFDIINLSVGSTETTKFKVSASGNAYVAGNLGIGISNPTYKLDVEGSLQASDYYSGNGNQGDSTTTGGLTFEDGLYISGSIAGDTGVGGSGTAGYLAKWTGGNTLGNALNVYDDGTNVGIGLTNPSYKLDVSGTVNVGDSLIVGSIPSISDNNLVLTSDSGVIKSISTTDWDKDSSDDYASWLLMGDGGTAQSIGSGDTATIAGGIGIATTAGATDTVTVNVDESYGFSWTGTHSYSASDLNFTNGTAFTLDVTGDLNLDADGGDILFGDNGTWWGGWKAGNFGIGITDPNYELDVVGTVNVGDSLIVGSVASVSDNNRVLTISGAGSGTVEYLDTSLWDKDYTDDSGGGWVLDADGGTAQSIGGGDTATIAGGIGIATTAGATDTVTINVDESYGFSWTGTHSYSASDLNFTNGTSSTLDVSGDLFLDADGGEIYFGDAGSWFGGWSAGNFGIGTTSPKNKLDVSGAVAIGSLPTASLPQANMLYVSGNVGIGTTDPGSYKLNVVGSGYFSTTLGVGTTTSTATLSLTGAFLDKDGQAGSSNQILSSTGSATDWVDISTIGVGGSGTIGYLARWATTSTLGNALNVYDDGTNVGIGLTNPSYKLDVSGTVNVGDSLIVGSIPSISDNNLVLTTDSGVIKSISTSSWDKDSSDEYANWVLDADSGTGTIINSGDTATIAGGIGIGTTIDAGTVTVNVDESYGFSWTGTQSYSAADLNFTNGTSFTLDVTGDLYLDADGGDILFGDAGTWWGGWKAGNFGIGITDPNYELDVSGTVNVGDSLIVGSIPSVADNNVVLTSDSGVIKSISTTNWDKDTSDDYASWVLDADGGTAQTISAGDTMTVVGGIGIATTAGATDTVTVNVDESYGFAWTGTHDYSASDINLTNGTSTTIDVTGDLYLDADGGDILFGDAGTWWGGWKAGNFGIGTTSPKNKLDVSGAVAIGSLPGAALPQANMLYVSGNVGIGNTGPSYKLDVEGTLQADDYYSGNGNQGESTTTGGLTFEDGLYISGSATVGYEGWVLDADSGTGTSIGSGDTATIAGGIGIGTTINAGTVTINVDEATNFAWTGTHSYSASDLNFTNGTVFTLDVTGDLYLDADGGDILFGDNGIWWGGWKAGNFGVGITDPNYELDVVGTVNVGDSLIVGSIPSVADNNVVLTSDSGVIKYINTSSWDKDSSDDFGAWMLMGDGGTAQSIGGGDTATIAGGIGIATTAGATDTVTVNVDESYGFAWTGTHSYSASDLNFTNGTSSTLDVSGDLFLDADGGEIYFGDAGSWFGGWSAGNFGIGTTSPKNKLDVSGAVAIGSLPTASLPQANMLYVSGNVGIGTTGPSYKLDIAGTVNVGDSLIVGSIPSVSDNNLVLTTDSGVIKSISTSSWDKDSSDDYASWVLDADGGTAQTISAGDTMTVAGGIGIATTAGATDTVTINVDESYGFAWTGTHSYSAADINFTNGTSSTLDVTGDLFLDADGGDILFGDAGTWWGGWKAGNFGVGITDPNYELDVSGTVNVGDSLIVGSIPSVADNNVVLTSDSGVIKYVDTSLWDKDYTDDSGGGWVLDADGGTAQTISAGDTMTVAGGIGIATTAGATDTVTVNVDESYGFSWTGTHDYSASDINLTNGTSFTLDVTGDLHLDADGGDILFGDAGTWWGGWKAGNFGVGITDPGSYKLNVVGSGYFSTTLGVGTTLSTTTLSLSGAFLDKDGQAGSSNQILTSTGSATDWVDISTIGTGGSGTAGYLPKWTSSSILGNSVLYDDGTNIGIGFTNPSAMFHIASTAAQELFRVDDNGEGDSTPFYIEEDGMVGIGTTNAWDILNVGGQANFAGTIYPFEPDAYNLGATNYEWYVVYANGLQSGSGDELYLDSGTTTIAVTDTLKLDGLALDITTDTNENLDITPNGSGDIKLNTDSDTDVYVVGTGNMGIGTTAPKNKLDVSGAVAIGSLPGASLPQANMLYVSGNVGIGTTNPGSYNLNVNGTAAFNNAGVTIDSNSYVNAQRFVDTGSNYYIDPASTTTSGLFAANVGIGTTAPKNKLDVSGAVAIGSLPGASLPQANMLYVSGNVGIGTTNPNEELAVAGDIDATGHMALAPDGTISTDTILDIDETFTSEPSVDYRGIDLSMTFNYTPTTDYHPTALNVYAALDDVDQGAHYVNLAGASIIADVTAGSVGDATGIYTRGSTSHSSGTVAAVYGLDARAQNNNTGTVTWEAAVAGYARNEEGNLGDAYGGYFSVFDYYSSGTLSNAYGVNSYIYETSSGSITTGYGFYSDCNDATTCYGLYVAAGDADVTTDWGVYVTGEDNNYFSGNVGIGTTGPKNKLDVSGAVAIGSLPGAALPQANMLYISGNVGIGTTNPSYPLSVVSADTLGIEIQNSGSSNKSWRLKPSGNDLHIAETGVSTPMVFQAGGNIGIGTTNPNTLLEIFDTDTPQFRISYNTNNYATFGVSGSGGLTIQTLSSTGSNEDIELRTPSFDNAIYIDESALAVGIGTNAPKNKLDVSGAVAIGSLPGASLSQANMLYVSGNVGIGTTNPVTALEVYNGDIQMSNSRYITWTSSSTKTNAAISGSPSSNSILFYAGNGSTSALLAELDYETGFGVGSVGMTIGYSLGTFTPPANGLAVSGNVGIGTTDPGAKLNVVTSGNLNGIRIDADSNDTGNLMGLQVSYTNTSSGTDYAAYINQEDGSSVSTNTLLHLRNSDTNTSVTSAILILDSGGGGFDNFINTASFLVDGAGETRVNLNYAANTNGLCHSGTDLDAATNANRYIIPCTGAPGDVAEWYDTIDGESGDIMISTGETITYQSPIVNARTGEVLNEKENITASVLAKATQPYQSNLLGIISTSPVQNFGRGVIDYAENPNPVALIGRTPVKVSTINGQIEPGDPLTSSVMPGIGMKATRAGATFGKALEPTDSWNEENCSMVENPDTIQWPEHTKPCFRLPDGTYIGKITVFVGISWYDPDVYLTDTGDLKVEKEASGEFVLKDNNDDLVERVSAFGQAVIAELQTGIINTSQLVSQKITSQEIKTQKLISPLVESQNIETERMSLKEIEVNNELTFKNENQEIIASLDTQGNATFSGKLRASKGKFGELLTEEVKTNSLETQDATIAGTLYAKKIVSEEISSLQGKFGELLAATVSAQKIQGLEERLAQLESQPSPTPLPSPTPSASPEPETDPMADVSLDPEIEALVNEILNSSTEATSQANLNSLSGEDLNIASNLTVLGMTSLADTAIAGTLNVDGTMTLTDNTINSLTGTLYLQNLGLGGIDILAGKITIDEQGNAVFEGNLAVKGRLALSQIEPLPGQDLTINLSPEASSSGFGQLLVKGVENEVVASIDASGSATFKKLAIAKAGEEVNQISPTEIETNATAGQAILPEGKTEIIIKSAQVTDQTMVYITPTSDSQNKVLFVKAKQGKNDQETGWFKVGIDVAINQDIQFNWWLIN